MQGRHELAAQHGGWGYYGVVRLDVEVVSTFRGIRVEFTDGGADWKVGVEFGIAYAYEKSLGAQPNAPGATVRVLEFRGHDVDTTEVIAAFVAARAFFMAIRADPPAGLELKAPTGEVVFPK
jgi:hypothetical protein